MGQKAITLKPLQGGVDLAVVELPLRDQVGLVGGFQFIAVQRPSGEKAQDGMLDGQGCLGTRNLSG
jgi:hypothetical protein